MKKTSGHQFPSSSKTRLMTSTSSGASGVLRRRMLDVFDVSVSRGSSESEEEEEEEEEDMRSVCTVHRPVRPVNIVASMSHAQRDSGRVSTRVATASRRNAARVQTRRLSINHLPQRHQRRFRRRIHA